MFNVVNILFNIFNILSFLWFIRTTKAILFWLYLWQLKEYHIGRFIDHFRTEKGKQLLFNKLILLKLVLILILISSFFIFLTQYPIHYTIPLPWGLFSILIPLIIMIIMIIIYFTESIKAFRDFFEKKLKVPILTKKTLSLISLGILIEILFLFILYQSQQYIYALAGRMETLRMVDIYNTVADSLPLFGLILFDIFTPLITSVLVLIFQPLAVLGRNQIIKKAKAKRENFKELLVIGITGSYGKTSTKEFLATILGEKFNVLKTKEHQNTEIGVSQCILNDLKSEHEIFIVEMGAYKRGEIKLLCDITKPKIGILTGVNEQHLALFGSMENLLSAEGGEELIESLPEDGLAIFNGNNKYCLELYQKIQKRKKITYKDLWAENIKVGKEKIEFRVFLKDYNLPTALPLKRTPGDFADFKVNLLGAQNIENILLATQCATELGMSLEEIAESCKKIEPWQSGMQLKKGINDLNIIDATYSANPDGVISHLEYLKIWPTKKIIVMPCLIELGSSSKEVHKRIGKKIGEVCDLAIITTKERFKEISEGASNALFIENPKEIFEKIKSFCRQGDIVLLESRVPSQLIQQLTINPEGNPSASYRAGN